MLGVPGLLSAYQGRSPRVEPWPTPSRHRRRRPTDRSYPTCRTLDPFLGEESILNNVPTYMLKTDDLKYVLAHLPNCGEGSPWRRRLV